MTDHSPAVDRDALASAWDEGYAAGLQDQDRDAEHRARYDVVNPYRDGDEDEEYDR